MIEPDPTMTTQPALLVVTGASGAGKTTLVRALDTMRIPGVGCHELDSMEVPSAEEMIERWGGTMEWQNEATRYWIERLLRNDGGHEVAVLDGQVRPSEVRAAFTTTGPAPGALSSRPAPGPATWRSAANACGPHRCAADRWSRTRTSSRPCPE